MINVINQNNGWYHLEDTSLTVLHNNFSNRVFLIKDCGEKGFRISSVYFANFKETSKRLAELISEYYLRCFSSLEELKKHYQQTMIPIILARV